MFDKQYRFYGSHAYKVKALKSYFGQNSKLQIFQRSVDLLVNAPLIGFLYTRNTPENREKDQDGNSQEENVFLEQINTSRDAQLFNFQLIMLLDESYEPDLKKRKDSAFKFYNNDLSEDNENLSPENLYRKERTIRDLKHYYGYLRGGIDILYSKLIEGCGSTEDFIEHLVDFILDFNERFNDEIDKDDLERRCLIS